LLQAHVLLLSTKLEAVLQAVQTELVVQAVQPVIAALQAVHVVDEEA